METAFALSIKKPRKKFVKGQTSVRSEPNHQSSTEAPFPRGKFKQFSYAVGVLVMRPLPSGVVLPKEIGQVRNSTLRVPFLLCMCTEQVRSGFLLTRSKQVSFAEGIENSAGQYFRLQVITVHAPAF